MMGDRFAQPGPHLRDDMPTLEPIANPNLLRPAVTKVDAIGYDFWILLVPLAAGPLAAFWFSATAQDSLWLLLFGLPWALFWLAEFALLNWLTVKRWRSVRRGWTWFGALTLLFVSIGLTTWPLRLGFAISRPSFEALVRRFESGEKLRFPVRAGLYTIVAIEERGNTMLVLRGPQGGREGFVYSAEATDWPGFNPWSEDRLDAKWWRVTED